MLIVHVLPAVLLKSVENTILVLSAPMRSLAEVLGSGDLQVGDISVFVYGT